MLISKVLRLMSVAILLWGLSGLFSLGHAKMSGDFNDNGEIDPADAMFARQMALPPESIYHLDPDLILDIFPGYEDVDGCWFIEGDGEVTDEDAEILEEISAYLIPCMSGEEVCGNGRDDDGDGDVDCMDSDCLGESCDDNGPCTINYTCREGGACEGVPVICDDGFWCNGAETCDPVNGCQAGTAVDCSGLDEACKEGECDEGLDSCVAANKANGTDCPDDWYCNGAEICQDGSCQAGTAVDCSGLDEACKLGECDEGLDSCVATNIDCDIKVTVSVQGPGGIPYDVGSQRFILDYDESCLQIVDPVSGGDINLTGVAAAATSYLTPNPDYIMPSGGENQGLVVVITAPEGYSVPYYGLGDIVEVIFQYIADNGPPPPGVSDFGLDCDWLTDTNGDLEPISSDVDCLFRVEYPSP